ncbi:MAG: phosphoenolpyruvate mutase [Alphaproteobacteria bacterium]
MTVSHATLVPPRSEPPTKAAAFRAELTAPELSFLMEAHDGLSAKIVEEAGFKGIWASGLTMSAALGVRDSNEASWTQVLEVLEFMADATSIPIMVDGDTGYGNFNNVRRLVKKLCQRGIAAVCIEDKLFPKTNSFIGEGQPLADIDEFCGRLKAGKDSQSDEDFSIIARTEALISGWGLDEALRRAEAYHAAGADGILIHSKQKAADEVLAFAREWGQRCPVLIVPTTYYATPTDEFRKVGIAMAIWANHNLRASITAMREVSRRIAAEQSLAPVEGTMVAVREVFALVGNEELIEAERRYLTPAGADVRAIVLAASQGAEFGALTESVPKCMLDVRGQPLLRRLVSTFNDCGVRKVTVVRGFAKEAIDVGAIDTVDNDDFASTGEAASLACAADRLEGDCLVCYGDTLFRRYIVEALLEAEGDVVLAADALWRERGAREPEQMNDLVSCSRPFTGAYLDDEPVDLVGIGRELAAERVDAEWIGVVRLSGHGAALVRAELEAMRADGSLGQASLPDLFARLVAGGHTVRVVYVAGHWFNVNDAFDLARARNVL